MDRQMGFGSLAGAGHCRADAHPGCAQPALSPNPSPWAPSHGTAPALKGWAVPGGGCPRVWAASGHPPPPHEVGREVQGGEAAWLGAQVAAGAGAQSRGGTKPCQPSGSWHLPHRNLGRQESGKGVRLQVWAPPEGDPTRALPPGSSLGRRERSCPTLSEPIQYLCQENGARPVLRLRLGGEREQPSFRGQTTQIAQPSLRRARAQRSLRQS